MLEAKEGLKVLKCTQNRTNAKISFQEERGLKKFYKKTKKNKMNKLHMFVLSCHSLF